MLGTSQPFLKKVFELFACRRFFRYPPGSKPHAAVQSLSKSTFAAGSALAQMQALRGGVLGAFQTFFRLPVFRWRLAGGTAISDWPMPSGNFRAR